MRYLAFLMLLSTAVWAQEPPRVYRLKVNGKSYPIYLDKNSELLVNGQRWQVKLEADPDRLFEYKGVSFRYPASMNYEKDSSTPGVTIFSLDGNNSVIMLMAPSSLVRSPSFFKDTVTAIKIGYGLGKVSESPYQVKLGAHTLKGVRLQARLVGEVVVQDLLRFTHRGSEYILVLQDSPQGKQPSRESIEVLKMLQKSFQLK
jgi:hypothetical protein